MKMIPSGMRPGRRRRLLSLTEILFGWSFRLFALEFCKFEMLERGLPWLPEIGTASSSIR